MAFDTASLTEQAKAMYLRPSALRKKDGVSEEDQIDHEQLLARLDKFKGMVLSDGTPFLGDGKYGLCRWEVQVCVHVLAYALPQGDAC